MANDIFTGMPEGQTSDQVEQRAFGKDPGVGVRVSLPLEKLLPTSQFPRQALPPPWTNLKKL